MEFTHTLARLAVHGFERVERAQRRVEGVGNGATSLGEVGEKEKVPENRVELTFPRSIRGKVVAALRSAHPYEEPAFHVVTNVADEKPEEGTP